MVLLENFGAEPFSVKLGRSNGTKFVCMLRRRVPQRNDARHSKVPEREPS